MKFPIAAALALLLSACLPAVPVDPGPGVQPGDTLEGSGDGLLVEREPDLCHAADYQQYVGQPGSVVPGLRIPRETRVIPFGGIYSQEYVPGRINFWLAPSGMIERIGCG